MCVTWAVLVSQPACLLLPPWLQSNCSSPAPTMSIQPKSCQPCSLKPNTCLPPPMCQSKPECSLSISTMFDTTACLLLLPCPVKPKYSFPTSIMSIQAQVLISCLHCLKLSLNAHSHLHHIHSSLHACHPPPPCLLEHKCLSLISIASNWAWMLVSHLCCVHWSLNTPTSTMSIWACMLAIHLHHVYLSADTCFPSPLPQIEPKCLSPTFIMSIGVQTAPPPPCPFEPECLSSISTTSIWAQSLVSCFLLPLYFFLCFLDCFWSPICMDELVHLHTYSTYLAKWLFVLCCQTCFKCF